MMRNRGVNDPTSRARGRSAPHSGVVHATVPGVPVGDREVGQRAGPEGAQILPARIPQCVPSPAMFGLRSVR